jgi:hypothetical protein
MKIKQLLLSLVTLSVFLVSCSKEEIGGFEIKPNQSTEQNQIITNSVSTQNARVNTESNLKAYIFIERQARTSNIVNHLNTIPRNSQSTGTRFYAYFTGIGLFNTNYRDLDHYYNMVLWNNGTLNQVLSVDVPQTTGGVDEHGNNKTAYNFSTVKIPKGTLNEWGWVTVLIPTSAMNNDTKRQTKIAYYSKNGNTITSSSNGSQTILNVNQMLSSYVIYSNGTVIPQGSYRVYSTYSSSAMRIKFNTTNDVYFRGAGN